MKSNEKGSSSKDDSKCLPGWNSDDKPDENAVEGAMTNIPNTINQVTVEFATVVNKSVHQRVVDALEHTISKNIAAGHELEKIYISSANDSHSLPSRHAQAKAVDISRINGTKIVIGYPSNTTVKSIVDAIQDRFESYQHCRENFGPKFKKKLGQPYPSAPDHNDHIHLSVN